MFKGEQQELAEKCALLKEEKSLAIEDKDYLIGILSDATFVLKQALEVNTNLFVLGIQGKTSTLIGFIFRWI